MQGGTIPCVSVAVKTSGDSMPILGYWSAPGNATGRVPVSAQDQLCPSLPRATETILHREENY